MPRTSPNSREPGCFYSIEQIACLLGVSDRTIRRQIKTGDLVAHRIGQQWRIAKADLEAFLQFRRGIK